MANALKKKKKMKMKKKKANNASYLLSLCARWWHAIAQNGVSAGKSSAASHSAEGEHKAARRRNASEKNEAGVIEPAAATRQA